MNGRSRLGSLAIAATLAFAQLAPAGHDLLVRHAVCAEHGERTHADAGDPQALAAPARDALGAIPLARPSGSLPPALRAPSVRSSSDARATDEHDHCRTLVLRGRVVPAHREIAVPRPDAPPAASPERDPAPPSIAVYRLAPKNSPPVG